MYGMIPAKERFQISDQELLFPLKQQYIVKPFKFYLKAPKQHWIDSQETCVLFMIVALCDFWQVTQSLDLNFLIYEGKLLIVWKLRFLIANVLKIGEIFHRQPTSGSLAK